MHEDCTLDGGHCGCLRPSTDTLLGALKWSDLHGIDPDFTDGLPASEWLARERCGDHHAHAIAEAAREYVAAFQFRDWDSVRRLAGERQVAFDALVAAVDAERAEREPGCTCVRCAPNYRLMRGCPTCGNKRCPKVADHDNRCTGSNEPGQIPNPQH